MPLTRARLAAGGVALACLVGPAGAALADKPEETAEPDPVEQPDGDRNPDGGNGGGQDGGQPAEPVPPAVPAPPPDLEDPRPRPRPEPRRPRRRQERREPAQRGDRPVPRTAPRARVAPEESDAPAPPPEAPAREATPPERRPRDPRCEEALERGEELLTLADLCEGQTGDGNAGETPQRTASATGTVRNIALLGALGLLSVAGLRILALRSRDPS